MYVHAYIGQKRNPMDLQLSISFTGAVKVHDSLILRVLYAPITFFEQTPLGQVLNRLSSDVHTVDESLPFIGKFESFVCLSSISKYCSILLWKSRSIAVYGLAI